MGEIIRLQSIICKSCKINSEIIRILLLVGKLIKVIRIESMLDGH